MVENVRKHFLNWVRQLLKISYEIASIVSHDTQGDLLSLLMWPEFLISKTFIPGFLTIPCDPVENAAHALN